MTRLRIAHLSDPHLGPLPKVGLRELASKRVLGWINWHANRGGTMQSATIETLIADIHAAAPDEIVVTGDLVNLALEAEVGPALAFLTRLGPPERVAVIPGNHDAYVPGALRRADAHWGAYMGGDPPEEADFPYLRRRGPAAIIGVSSARATGPFLATGRVGERQAEHLAEILEATGREGLLRVVLVHHPPVSGSTAWNARLVDGARFRAAIRRAGAELVLHGHTHRGTVLHLAGPGTQRVPVLGVPSASARPGGEHEPAGWNLISLDGGGAEATISVERRSLGPDGTIQTRPVALQPPQPGGGATIPLQTA